ncbi:putative reverse transcriptase Ty1/copia-type domain-containing protein [Phytophthora infestans]|uniref:Putative reverse transcriptase Ty1/copia-type domain-containing protein n=1 Tax=Phytophthora infestans TaxID=4787 RepID=A0A8S9UAJ4_PHYIN|nr:putative reverse transcriptase Ty1/copia-type domain-containing protein [Phytophthora infestans]
MAPSDIEQWYFVVGSINVFEVRHSEDRREWEQAMEEVIQSLIENEIFVEVPLPTGRKAIKSKWVFNKKINPDGTLDNIRSEWLQKVSASDFGDDYT